MKKTLFLVACSILFIQTKSHADCEQSTLKLISSYDYIDYYPDPLPDNIQTLDTHYLVGVSSTQDGKMYAEPGTYGLVKGYAQTTGDLGKAQAIWNYFAFRGKAWRDYVSACEKSGGLADVTYGKSDSVISTPTSSGVSYNFGGTSTTPSKYCCLKPSAGAMPNFKPGARPSTCVPGQLTKETANSVSLDYGNVKASVALPTRKGVYSEVLGNSTGTDRGMSRLRWSTMALSGELFFKYSEACRSAGGTASIEDLAYTDIFAGGALSSDKAAGSFKTVGNDHTWSVDWYSTPSKFTAGPTPNAWKSMFCCK